ncbi:unnamed protein product, partial [Symbiodinium sp. CCMP2456]
ASIVLAPLLRAAVVVGKLAAALPSPGPGKKIFTQDEIAELMQKFMKASPSELVRLDIMLSSPFLALVRDNLDSKRFNWIPWRLCSSAFDEERFLEQRRPRTDTILLTRLLQEGPPEDGCTASVPQYAIALHYAAHLLHLRKAAEKFLSIALAIPSDRSIRPPSLQEIADADRALWVGGASIQSDQGWLLTDALADMIFARPKVYTALALVQEAPDLDDQLESGQSVAAGLFLPIQAECPQTACILPGIRRHLMLTLISPSQLHVWLCFLSPQGLRVVLAAYTLEAALHLEAYPSLRSDLSALAFPLPPAALPGLVCRGSHACHVLLAINCDCFPPVDLITDASRASSMMTSLHCFAAWLMLSPKPLRDFEFPSGRPALSWEESGQLLESALLHVRTRILLSRVGASGGFIILEYPASSLTFHDQLMMDWISCEAPFCAQVTSCMVVASFSKSWMFICNEPCILDLASVCTHPRGTHESFVGKRDGSGFLSHCTAEYPAELAASLASVCAPFLSSLGNCVDFSRWRSFLPSPAWEEPSCRVEDGGGVHSTASWLQPAAADLLHSLRAHWSQRLFDTGLCLRIAAHLQLAPQGPPLMQVESSPFLQDIFEAFQVSPPEQADLLFIAPGQPLRLRLLNSLLLKIQDPEASLYDQLESVVSLGVGASLEPSLHWPKRDSELVLPALRPCEGAWKSADSEPDIVHSLLEEELRESWISEYASLEAIRNEFPQDVSSCAPSFVPSVPWVGASIDVKNAHRRMKMAQHERALLAFSFRGRYFVSICLNFGARASSWYWARLAGAIHRVTHYIIFLKHFLWVYVD